MHGGSEFCIETQNLNSSETIKLTKNVAASFSLGHGGNDAQKSMGIIWVALIVSGLATKNLLNWILA